MQEQLGKTSRRSGLAQFFSKGNQALLRIVGDRIRQEGRITFAEFMELALYHPELGYYNSSRERIGRHGDFLTSPETHPVFGALIARQLEQMWRALGRPQRFEVVETGAALGTLCRDILTYARSTYPEFFSAIRYRLVERSAASSVVAVPPWRSPGEGEGHPSGKDAAPTNSKTGLEQQKATLRSSGIPLHRIRWYPSLSRLPHRKIVGCFLSNELVDAFPFHRVVNDGGEIKEVYVGLDGEEFVDVVGPPSTPAIVDYFRWVGVDLPVGNQAEVNLRAVEWIKELARRLRRGFVLTIDYGYPASELYSPARPRGTLLCYYMHTYLEDPYVRVGQQDITAHVDFTALAKAGEEEGLMALGPSTQRDFLLSLGLPDFVSELERQGLGAVDYRANRLAMEELVKPDGLGRLKVLVQTKGS